MSGGESLFLRRRLANEFGLQVHPFRYSAAYSTMTEITARLQSFVESLGSPVVHFVGHSLGGLVIYRFLERFPQRVGKTKCLRDLVHLDGRPHQTRSAS
jgi:pimeloyl-ACP methyl ester carboxylesterase